jgi:hypothetical protein
MRFGIKCSTCLELLSGSRRDEIHPAASRCLCSSFRLIGSCILRIIFRVLKNIGRARAKLDKIFPAQFQPGIDLLQFGENHAGHTLARHFEGPAHL